MFIDDITIKVEAGNGGHGAVAFNKNLMSLGPSGGTGGKGGSIYGEGVADIGGLRQFRSKKVFRAEDGKNGREQFVDGRDGEDLILKLPVGTVIHNLSVGDEKNVDTIGERVLIAQGGLGGRGNFHFRSSRNTSPKESRPGTEGECFDIRLELKLIADVGFVGLPNIGKSTLLNRLTNAKSKVANYAFTTLDPNLGAYYELILADIPGLIEGSSFGKGMGIKFLRHIERTRIIFHFISAESEDPESDYFMVRKELGAYKKELLQKPEYLILTKTDLVPEAEVNMKLSILKRINPQVIGESMYDPESLKGVQKILNKIKAEKDKSGEA